MKTFDFYEFTGILLPGAVCTWGLTLLFPELGQLLLSDTVSIGDLGLFAMAAYVTGHLIQGLGNLGEILWWKLWGGWPTDWVQQRKGDLLADAQLEMLFQRIPTTCHLDSSTPLESLDARAWRGITSQLYAAVAAAGRATRIDTFNGNYGLNRGLASAFLITGALAMAFSKTPWTVLVLLGIGTAVAVYRMHRFARHYARELFVQFLQLAADEAEQKE